MILKQGDRAPEVQVLQEFLNSTEFKVAMRGPGSPGRETDFFGSMTDIAVRRWQTINGLTVDGIVGPITWAAMGLATTDAFEQCASTNAGVLEIKKHYLPAGEYLAGPTRKDWVFLHHTAGWNNPYNTINNWGRDARGAVSTEFVLGGQKITDGDSTWDGELVQAFPEGGYGWHLGTGNNVMHRNSVGIEVNNFGYLTKGGWHRNRTWIAGDPDKFYTYVGTVADPNQIVTLSTEFRGHKYWHKYSDSQISVLKQLILFIANRDSIDVTKGLPDLIRKRGEHVAFNYFDVSHVTRTPGLWNHTNVRRDKTDMFPQPELIDMLLEL